MRAEASALSKLSHTHQNKRKRGKSRSGYRRHALPSLHLCYKQGTPGHLERPKEMRLFHVPVTF